LSACLALILGLATSAGSAEPDDDRAKEQFRSEDYTVTWGTPAAYEPDAELEVGDGNGHGGTLGWLRFLPGKDGVEVLSIQFDEGRHPYESKWPPDRAPVVVKRALLTPDAYAALVRQLAVVNAAKLTPVEREGITSSSNSFWVNARLTTNEKTLLELSWAGYEGSGTEPDFAKPRAAVRLARETVNGLDFKEHALTDGDRAWASAKFSRDWTNFKGQQFHWWVRERYIETIGVVGDKAAFPVLSDILSADPPKGEPRTASNGRCVYYAINAVTRLTKRDVRDEPVDEMDIEQTRQRVLDLIKDEQSVHEFIELRHAEQRGAANGRARLVSGSSSSAL
jgi:hypothetical protein